MIASVSAVKTTVMQ